VAEAQKGAAPGGKPGQPPVDGCYMGVVGASFAATHVSGAAAVLLYEAKRAPPRPETSF